MQVLILLSQEVSPQLLIISSFPINSGASLVAQWQRIHLLINARDENLIPRAGKYPGGGHGNPLQYFCLESPMNRGAWRATVHGIAKESGMTWQLNNNNKSINPFILSELCITSLWISANSCPSAQNYGQVLAYLTARESDQVCCCFFLSIVWNTVFSFLWKLLP